VFFLTLPGFVVCLAGLAVIDRLGWWVSRRSGLPWFHDGHRPAPASALDELQAMFQAAKRHEIEVHRQELVLHDDENDDAPPLVRIDMDANLVIITHPVRNGDSNSSEHWQALATSDSA